MLIRYSDGLCSPSFRPHDDLFRFMTPDEREKLVAVIGDVAASLHSDRKMAGERILKKIESLGYEIVKKAEPHVFPTHDENNPFCQCEKCYQIIGRGTGICQQHDMVMAECGCYERRFYESRGMLKEAKKAEQKADAAKIRRFVRPEPVEWSRDAVEAIKKQYGSTKGLVP